MVTQQVTWHPLMKHTILFSKACKKMGHKLMSTGWLRKQKSNTINYTLSDSQQGHTSPNSCSIKTIIHQTTLFEAHMHHPTLASLKACKESKMATHHILSCHTISSKSNKTQVQLLTKSIPFPWHISQILHNQNCRFSLAKTARQPSW